MKRALVLLFVFCTAAGAREKEAFAVWSGKNCVILSENVKAFAPMKDGLPDYKNVHLTGVQLDSKCMSYEIK
jgi:hypothetical protein